jgi:hypothetical protein
LVTETVEVCGRYDEKTLSEMKKMLDAACTRVPKQYRESIRFDIENVGYAYDPSDYPYLVMKYKRLENDKEYSERVTREEKFQLQREENEKKEFERLSKKFAQ